MAAPVASCASRRFAFGSKPYSARLTARLRPLASAAVLALALANGGCAVSGQVGSLFGSDKADTELTTGSIKRPSTATTPPSGLPPDTDLVYARKAVTHLLSDGKDTTSIPWENPKTGARGMVTPIASTYQEAGVTCRDFLASYLHEKTEAWLQGEACLAKGQWEVRSFRPWKRS